MAEWFNAPVLKTGVGLVLTQGSNPCPSANVVVGECLSCLPTNQFAGRSTTREQFATSVLLLPGSLAPFRHQTAKKVRAYSELISGACWA